MKTLVESERAKVIATFTEAEKSEVIEELVEEWYQLRLTIAHIHPCGDEHINFDSKNLVWICPLCGVDFLNDTIDDMIPKIMIDRNQQPLVVVNQVETIQ